ncbi:MAG: acetyl-CoA carboxylase biotin carboxyl carrier protein [Tenericutes bacterium HGW-Tenericutes-3]|nr:MAG: acetyl-CoA carboxylase biotin carboxyl carrier protein [Tenericutes bacterium HGW-Tenericutes-3]
MTIKEIQGIIKDFEGSTVMTLELEMEGFKLKLSKNKNDEVIIKEEYKTKEQTQTQKIDNQSNHTLIKSPLVGTFYAASTPKGKPFVEVGQQIKKGQVVCIIEAMKIMNEITSPFNGVVKDIFVHNGDVVGFDHNLIRVGDPNEK